MARLLILFILAFSFGFSADPVKLMFLTFTLKEKDFSRAVESVSNSMQREGLGVKRTLKLSDALRNRGVDFPDYYIVFGCFSEKNTKLLEKVPALTNLLPCSVAIYKDKDGRIKASIANYRPYLAKYYKNLSNEDRNIVVSSYNKLIKALSGLSVKPQSAPYVPPPKEDLVSEALVEGLGYDEFLTLYKSSLEGKNMNVLDVINLAPNYNVLLACNLSYGEKILRNFPQFGTLAPCRIYVKQEDKGIRIGYINIPLLVKLYGKQIGEEGTKIFQKAQEDLQGALEEATGR